MVRRTKPVLAALCIASTVMAAANAKQEAGLEAGRRAYEASDYAKAIQVLQTTAANDPQNGDVQLLLTKSYLEMLEYDPAIKSAEKAVAIDPQNSVYHEWLGRAYGEKADHASLFSAISLAKKTRKEFETAIQLALRASWGAARRKPCRRSSNWRRWTPPKGITRLEIAGGRRKTSPWQTRNLRKRWRAIQNRRG